MNGGTDSGFISCSTPLAGARSGIMIEAAKSRSSDEVGRAPLRRQSGTALSSGSTAPIIMSPWEMRVHISFIACHAEPHPQLEAVLRRIDRFADDWAAVWTQYETDRAGVAGLRGAAQSGEARASSRLDAPALQLRNHLQLLQVLDHIVLVWRWTERPRRWASSSEGQSAPTSGLLSDDSLQLFPTAPFTRREIGLYRPHPTNNGSAAR